MKESRAGKISDLNTRYSLTIPKELKAKFELLAKEESRSLNNMLIYALDQYLKAKDANR